MSDRLTPTLIALIGEDGLIALAEAYGGRRLYVPEKLDPDHGITKAIGEERAAKLNRLYSLAYIRVPIARELRAVHYRKRGLSNGEIATKLGIVEPSVDKIFARMAKPPVKGSAQLSLDI